MLRGFCRILVPFPSSKWAAQSITARQFSASVKCFTPMIEGLSDNCWQQSSQRVQHPALSQNLETDVCVVGAGIAGLTTAYRLAAAGTYAVESAVVAISLQLPCAFAACCLFADQLHLKPHPAHRQAGNRPGRQGERSWTVRQGFWRAAGMEQPPVQYIAASLRQQSHLPSCAKPPGGSICNL